MPSLDRFIRILAVILAFTPAFAPAASAQDTSSAAPPHAIVAFFSQWDARAHRAQIDQPNWLTPVVTSTSRLKQEFRYDMSWQSSGTGASTANYGGSKGLTTIPIDRVEISINPPPYIVNGGSRLRDGFGDFSILAKFRLIAANRQHGDYAITAFLATTLPTGSYKNGSPHPVITPTIAGGKGVGDFVYEGTFGGDLPSSQADLLGRRLILNNAIQYRRLGRFWPELEVNSNFYNDGPNHGKKQIFLTPGISVGRFPLYGHLQLTMGAGIELAVTHFHSYTHQGIFTVRLPF